MLNYLCRDGLGALHGGAGGFFRVCPQCSCGIVAATSAGVGVAVFFLVAVAVTAAGFGVVVFVFASVVVVVTGTAAAVPVTGVGNAVHTLAFVAVAGAEAEVIRVELVVEPVLEVVGVLRLVRVADADALSQQDFGKVAVASVGAVIEGSS